MRKCSPWAFLPSVYSISTAVGLWAVYFIAVSNDAVTPLCSNYRPGGPRPPYISIAGNVPPASCIFSQVMNLAAFVVFSILGFFSFSGMAVGVLRYLQLKHSIQKPWLNIVSLVAFSLACFGMTLVGNFQLSNQETVHNIGTFMAFGLATLFCWVQSVITLKVNLRNEGRMVAIPRFLLSGAITVCMVAYFSLMAQRLHMHASRTQWALVMFLLSFIGTFAVEFRHYRFDLVCMEDRELPLSQAETCGISELQSDQL